MTTRALLLSRAVQQGAAFSSTTAPHTPHVEVAPGQVDSGSWDDDGTYRVAKVLVVDEQSVHVRVYS